MISVRSRLAFGGLVAAAALVLAVACSKSPTGPGQLRVSMVDAAPLGVDQIWVNVTKVTAHSSSDGWVTVSTTPMTIDLLSLQTSPLTLGLVQLSAGRVTQIRLYVTKDANWVHVTGDLPGAKTTLVVPSGFESGIKIPGPWRVDACERTSVTIDFDGLASLEVHATGTGNEWILRPVVRLRKTDTSPVACQGGGGATCDAETPCPEGQVCVTDTCAPAQSGGGATTPCSGGGECLSESCVSGTCAQSPPSGPCRTNDDCTNHVCQDDGSCAPCTKDAECPVGFSCTGGTCTSNL